MRKHFLILMLLTLLPLAGWAQTVDVEVKLYDFTITYGDDEPTVGTLPLTAIRYESTPALSADQLTAVKGFLTFTRDAGDNVGTYNWTVTKAATTPGYNIYLSSNNAKMTIAKATTNNWTTDPAVIADAAQYDGAPKDLLQTEGVATFGTTEYSIDGGTTWATGMPQATNAGVYTVQARVQGTENYVGRNAEVVGDATINGTDITEFTAPEPIADLKFTNGPQYLVTAGTATGGTVMYSVDGGAHWSEDRPQGTNAGPYNVSWMVKGDANYNDKAAVALAEITIGKGTPVITLPNLSSNVTYNGLQRNVATGDGSATLGATVEYKVTKWNGATWANVGGPTGAGTDASALTVKDAGRYKIKAKVTGTANLNEVAFTSTETEFEIAKAPLTVSTKGCSKIYGEADPTFEVVYDGFVNNENADDLATAGEFTKAVVTRAPGTDAGYYALSITTDATAVNYEINNSTTTNYLLINPKPLVATGTGAVAITFGANPVYDGTAKEANITSVSFDGSAKTAYVPATGVGDYAVSYDGTTNINAGDAAKVIITGKNNYTGSVEKTFTIDKAPIYVWPEAKSKTYGDEDPAFTCYLGNNEGTKDDDASLVNTPTLTRVAGENVGTYKIYLSAYTAAENDNYAVQNVGDQTTCIALFTINAKEGNELALRFKSNLGEAKTKKTYGEANPVWTIDDLEYVSGLVGDDEWDVVKNNIGTPVFALASEDAGETTVGVTGLASPNYPNVTVEPMDFTVDQRPITVTVTAQAITYGNQLADPVENTNWSVTTGNVVGTDVLGLTLETVNPILTYAVSATPYAEAINAVITNTNYDMTVVKGALTVSAGASITLNRADDMDALIKAYGGQNINVTLNRNITRTEAWFAMVLPFQTDMTELVNKFGYCVVNVLDESNADPSKVKFKLAFGTIAANQPFLVKLGTAIAAPVNFGEKPIVYNAAPESHDVAGNYFRGVFKKPFTLTVTDPDNSHYWMMVPANDKFGKVVDNNYPVTPINAYLETASVLNAFAPAIFVEDMDGTVTAINVVDGAVVQQNAEGWYNLNGVKLQGVPTEKGIYINNGKKVVIK